jgi:hypothetical protein
MAAPTTIRTPAEVARAAFDAIFRKDPEGIVAAGAPGYTDDFVAIGEMRGHDAIRGTDVMRITGGLIQHNTIYYDGAAFSRQIGMLPASGSRGERVLISAFNVRSRVSRLVTHRGRQVPR